MPALRGVLEWKGGHAVVGVGAGGMGWRREVRGYNVAAIGSTCGASMPSLSQWQPTKRREAGRPARIRT